jgi:lysophospholipase L1-like esterase
VRRIVAFALVAALSLAACTAQGPSSPSQQPSPAAAVDVDADDAGSALAQAVPRRLVTLGDAYTAGYATELPKRDSWPAQVVVALRRGDVPVVLVNLAERSVSSDTVREDQLGQVAGYQPDVVTLQVGVNDAVSGETAWYRGNLVAILDELLTLVPPERLFVITTPDDALDRRGSSDAALAEARSVVRALNEVAAEVAAERGVTVIDIGPLNQLGENDASLVVSDGLYSYPTAKQYAGWAEAISPYVHRALSTIEP